MSKTNKTRKENTKKKKTFTPESSRPKKAGSEVARNVAATVKDMVTASKVVLDVVKLINDSSWYTKPLPFKVAANPGRLMSQTNVQQIENRAFNGAVVRCVDVGLAMPRLIDNEAIKQAAIRMYQDIRLNLKSNLPYTVEFVRSFLLNSIYQYAILVNTAKNITFCMKEVPDVPDWQELWRHRVPTNASYGAMETSQISWLAEENFPTSITEYNKLASLTQGTAIVPSTWKKFIDYYIGNVFINDDDGQATQYENITINTGINYAYNADTDSVEEAYVYDFADIDPTYAKNEYSRFVATYSMVIADLVKARPQGFDGMDINYYGVNDQPFVKSSTLHNILVNAYTSNEGVNENGYVRLDDFDDPDCDNLAKFMFMGGLSSASESGFRVINMVYKAKLPAGTIVPGGIYQGQKSSVTLAKDTILGIVLTSDISTDTYINSSVGEAGAGQTFPASSTGKTVWAAQASNPTGIGVTMTLSDGQAGATGTMIAASANPDYHTPSMAVGDKGYLCVPICVLDTDINAASDGKHVAVAYVETPATVSGLNTLNFSELSNWEYGILDLRNPLGYTDGLIWTKSKPVAPSSKEGTGAVKAQGTLTWYDSTDPRATQVAVNGGIVYTFAGTISLTASIATTSTSMFVDYNNLPYLYATGHGDGLKIRGISNLTNAVSPASALYIATSSAQVYLVDYTTGFDALNSIGSDQFDYHIPMYHKVAIHLSKDGGKTWEITTTGTDLIKESYLSYFFNIKEI